MSGDTKTYHITVNLAYNRNWLQVVVVACIDGDQVMNWQLKFSIVKHRIMHIGLSLFLSKFCVVVDMFYWLNK